MSVGTKSSWIIIDTSHVESLVILQNKNGTTRYFTTRTEAERHTKKMAWWDNMHIIEIRGVLAE